MRFVFRFVGRDAGEQLSRPDGASERCARSHHRGNVSPCFNEAAARSVPGMRRRSVRHLHAGNDSCGDASAGEETGARADRHSRRACGQPLPLHGLHANIRSGDEGRASKSCKMRADPAEYKLVSPGNLQAVLALLASEPDQWLPIAGGTPVMVLCSAGKLSNRKLINIWNLPKLRQIQLFPEVIPTSPHCPLTALATHK